MCVVHASLTVALCGSGGRDPLPLQLRHEALGHLAIGSSHVKALVRGSFAEHEWRLEASSAEVAAVVAEALHVHGCWSRGDVVIAIGQVFVGAGVSVDGRRPRRSAVVVLLEGEACLEELVHAALEVLDRVLPVVLLAKLPLFLLAEHAHKGCQLSATLQRDLSREVPAEHSLDGGGGVPLPLLSQLELAVARLGHGEDELARDEAADGLLDLDYGLQPLLAQFLLSGCFARAAFLTAAALCSRLANPLAASSSNFYMRCCR